MSPISYSLYPVLFLARTPLNETSGCNGWNCGQKWTVDPSYAPCLPSSRPASLKTESEQFGRVFPRPIPKVRQREINGLWKGFWHSSDGMIDTPPPHLTNNLFVSSRNVSGFSKADDLCRRSAAGNSQTSKPSNLITSAPVTRFILQMTVTFCFETSFIELMMG